MPSSSDKPQSIYGQVANELRERIRKGNLAIGDWLPSGKEISREFGVATMTAQRAVKILEAEGLVLHRPGVGFIVQATPTDPPKPETEIAELKEKLETLKTQLKHVSGRVDELQQLSSHVNEIKDLLSHLDELKELPIRVKELEKALGNLNEKG